MTVIFHGMPPIHSALIKHRSLECCSHLPTLAQHLRRGCIEEIRATPYHTDYTLLIPDLDPRYLPELLTFAFGR
jgi:hypothetical protein